MTQSWKNKDDRKLNAILGTLPYLPFYGLIRQDKEDLANQKFRFFKTGQPPVFTYRRARAFDSLGYLAAVEKIKSRFERMASSPLVELYLAKIDELKTRAKLIVAIQKSDDELVTALSKSLYGQMTQNAPELEHEFAAMVHHSERFFTHDKPIDAQIFAKMVEQVLAHYQIDNWVVKIYDRPSVKINHLSKNPKIFIPKSIQISQARARRLLTHEIEVHVLRTHNGTQSPLLILRRGLDHYLPTDEGLAIYYQNQLRKNQSAHAPGFWDAWTTALTQQGNFRDTFGRISSARQELAASLGQDNPEAIGRDAAWRLCVRAYRGITDTSKNHTGFLRDHIYRSGYEMIKKAIEKQGEEILPMLFAGNVGLHHLDKIKRLDIPPGRTPDLISKKIVKEVMRAD